MRKSAIVVTAVLALAACSTSETKSAPSSSSIEGQVVASSFKAVPIGLVAIDEAGTRTSIALGAEGAFKSELAKAHTYRLAVLLPGAEEPVVFPRTTGGRLDLTFKISSGGAKLALGAVRHFDAAPAAGFPVTRAATECNEHEGDDGDGECVDGKDAKTGAPCKDDDDAEAGHDATKPMAVPEKSPPNDVSGCAEESDGDGEEDDD